MVVQYSILWRCLSYIIAVEQLLAVRCWQCNGVGEWPALAWLPSCIKPCSTHSYLPQHRFIDRIRSRPLLQQQPSNNHFEDLRWAPSTSFASRLCERVCPTVFFAFVSNALERARHPKFRLYSLTLSLIDEINASFPRRKYYNLSYKALSSVRCLLCDLVKLSDF